MEVNSCTRIDVVLTINITIGHIEFVSAHTDEKTLYKERFSIIRDGCCVDRSIHWIIQCFFDNTQVEAITELWSIMYENDEASLLMWKLKYGY